MIEVEETLQQAGKRELPEGWRWVPLGDVCVIVIGRTPRREISAYWGGDLPWVSIADLNNAVITTTRERITELGAQESRSRLLKAGTLLFSFKLTIGKMAFAGMDLYTNEAIAGLLPKRAEELDRNYLRFALSSIDPGSGSSHAVKGKTLNQDSLNDLRIPFPPTAEQQRIAAMLDEQMAAVERTRRTLEEQLDAINALPAALLRQAFNGEL